jgi:hypothetical protein
VKHANAVDITGMVGQRLEQEPTGWRDVKALLIVAGHESWNAAAALADALGVHPDDQERLYHEIRQEKGTKP